MAKRACHCIYPCPTPLVRHELGSLDPLAKCTSRKCVFSHCSQPQTPNSRGSALHPPPLSLFPVALPPAI